jgi:PAS domain S-box-containing protein
MTGGNAFAAKSMARFAGGLAVIVGGMVLVGWAFDIAALKSVLPGWVSMKPNAALAFILTGIALLFSLLPPSTLIPQRPAFIFHPARLCGWLAGLIGLLTLCEYVFGWNPGFDQWLFHEPAGAVGTSNPGRMAPDSALCFALLVAGQEIIRRRRKTPAMFVASVMPGLMVTTVALAEILSYFTPALRTYGFGGLTMMSLPTAMLFAVLGAALTLAAWRENKLEPDLHSWFAPLLVFLLLSAGFVAGGIFIYRQYARHFRAGVELQLSTIADLKADQLVQYRKERLGDANTFYNNSAFSERVRRFLEQPADADARRQLQAWLGRFQSYYEYARISLFDVQGAERLAVPDQPEPLPGHIAKAVASVLQSRQVMFLGFFRDAPGLPVQLEVLTPIFDESDTNRPLGVLVLRIDPETYLYPLLKQWPVPSKTAETLLVRRDGNDVLFLNELKFATNTALNLRIPLADTNVPAVMAVLGTTGIVQGRDYRNEPVIADLRAVPGTPWFMVAREDVAEVFAPLRERLWQMIVMLGVLIFASGTGVGLVWRQQRIRHYREKLEAQAEHAKLGAIVESSDDAIIGIDLDGVITSWNAGAESIYGYSAAEAAGKSVAMIIPPGQPDELTRLIEKIKHGEAVVHHETGRIRKNGERVQMSLTLSPVKDAAGTIVGASSIGRDITERKRAEDALRESQALYNSLVEQMPAGIFRKDRAGRYIFANSWFCQLRGVEEKQIEGRTLDELLALEGEVFGRKHPENLPFLRKLHDEGLKHHEEILRTGKPIHVEEVYPAAGGGKRHVSVVKSAVFGPDGQIVGTQGIQFDVTERKRTEEILRARLRLLQFAADHPLDALLQKTLDEVGLLTDSPIGFYHFVEADQKTISLQAWSTRTMREFCKAEGKGMHYNMDEAGVWLDCVRQRRALIHNDYAALPNRKGLPPGHATVVRELVVPVFRQDRIVAVLGVGNKPGDYNEKDVEVVTFMADVAWEIAVRKRAEARLRQLSSAVEHSPASIVITDPAGNIEYVNPKFTAVTGYSSREVIGKNPRVLKSGEMPVEGYQRMWQTILSGAEWQGEFHNRKKNGELFWESASISSILDDAGKIVHFVAVKEDITGHKLAGDALRESEERFRRVFEEGTTGMVMLDEKFHFIKVNPAFASMLGFSPEELQTMTFADVTHPDHVQQDVEQVRRMLRGEISEYRTEKRYLAKSGKEVWGQVQVSVVRTAAGKFHYILAIVSNITERKTAEARLQDTLAELERSNKELEQFAYVASHDLQEPLRMVSSYTQLLAKRFEGQLDEKTQKYVHYAVDGATRMRILINDLLAYARVGTRGQPFEPADSRAALGGAMRNLIATISETRAIVTNADLPTVRGDAPQLILLFQNLIANAIKFRSANTPSIHVSAQDRGREWVFAVKDNGIGIEPRHAERVFVIFQRLHTRDEYPGTGIGLAVCKRIVERHGGKIWFESEPGKGATFFFTIPK